MLGRAFGLVAASALGASAFLIPAGIAPADQAADIFTLSFINPKTQTINLPCSACAFPTKSEKNEDDEAQDDLYWIQGGANPTNAANGLLLNFTVSEEQDLQLNGHTIYPSSLTTLDKSRIYVNQIPASATREEIENGDVKSTPLEVTGDAVLIPEIHEVPETDDEIIEVQYAIYGIEKQRINLSRVKIELLRTADGELMIMRAMPTVETPGFLNFKDFIRPDGPTPPPSSDAVAATKCGSLPAPICKVKNMIESKLSNIKPMTFGAKKPSCHGGRRPLNGKLPTHIKPSFLYPKPKDEEEFAVGIPEKELRQPWGERPHHGRPHRGHHRHHRHSFLHAVARGFAAVLIPTMAGVAIGMAVSFVGLVVGRLISFLWIELVRGGRRGHASVALDTNFVECEDFDDEKMVVGAMVVEEEALPVYENAPAYEDAVKQEQ